MLRTLFSRRFLQPRVSLASLLLLGACASHAADDGAAVDQQARSAVEGQHAEALRQETGSVFRVEVSPELANVRHLEGRVPASRMTGLTASAKAISFLEAHPKLLGLDDARTSLRVEREEATSSGAHVRFQVVVSGVPVRGSEVMAHFDDAGDLVSMDARVVAGIALDVVPRMTSTEAAERGRSETLSRFPGLVRTDLHESGAPSLVVFAEPGRPARLAWHHVVRGMSESTAAVLDVTLDALTGEILEAFDDLETIKAKGVGVLGDEKELEVTQNGTTFTMVDGTRSAPIRTFSAGTQQTLPGTAVSSTQQNSWDNVAVGKGAAVDAHFFAGFVFDYYKNKFARSGIDGKNSPMVSTVHFGANYENAFWDGTQMAYGDGASRFKPLSAGLDVVAHEFTHGVTTSTSQLVYQGQPGALNEAISDILSTYIEHAYKPDDRNNWVTGEVIGASGPIRDLTNPRAKNQPSNMKEFVNTQQDNGGVHINSGIPNNAAYLMTMGGTNPYSKIVVGGKLGWEKAEKLWYEAETKYFMQRTDFAQAATMMVNAATALKYTDADVAVVKCAWIAVGVLDGPCDPLASGAPATPDAGVSPTTDGGAAPAPTTPSGAPGATPTPNGNGAKQGLLGEPNNGCNQTGNGPHDLGAFLGLVFILAARRSARRR